LELSQEISIDIAGFSRGGKEERKKGRLAYFRIVGPISRYGRGGHRGKKIGGDNEGQAFLRTLLGI